MNITKLQLCNRISTKRTGSKKGPDVPAGDLKTVLDWFLEEIFIVLSEGKNIEIRGFGSFKTKSRNGRTGRNPRTGEPVSIKPCTTPIFKISKEGQKTFNGLPQTKDQEHSRSPSNVVTKI